MAKVGPHKVLKYILITLLPFLFFGLFDLLSPFQVDVKYSQVIYAADSSILQAYLTPDDKWRLYTRLDEISPVLQKTIRFKEDRWFYWHFGVNPIAVVRAAFNNIVSGKRTSGASTITMQVARMLEPRARTYRSKIIEMFRALQLEWHYSKDEILQLYLNLVPYGGNIEGVKAASLLYFEQSPQAMSLAQVTALSVIPNNPTRLRPGRNNSLILQTRNRWLKKMQNARIFQTSTLQSALQEPLLMKRHAMPKRAPHLCNHIHAQSGKMFCYTTLQPAAQAMAEQLTRQQVEHLRLRGASNAAVLIVDNYTRGIVAYVGSADFYNSVSHGQVDGVQAVRSPGSTLKPFLYATAMDQGLVTPATVVSDVPMDFSGYRPENYDATCQGKVQITEALSQSLNIPAVHLLEQIGCEALIDLLSRGGCQNIQGQRAGLGLSLALGGCGCSLWELSGIYAALAGQGVYQPLHYLRKRPDNGFNDTLLSAEASFLVTQMLTRLKRPDLPARYQQVADLPRISWKTGTSYGRRDAWSIGYNCDYTIGVWVGNFDGSGVSELSGSEFATPLMFKLFKALQPKGESRWFHRPEKLKERLVCAESGCPPAAHCSNLITDWYIPGVSKNSKCNCMKQIWVSADERISFCRSCLPVNGYKQLWIPNLSPEIIAFYQHKHIPFYQIPPHNPACESLLDDTAPLITSLTNGMEYLLVAAESQQLALTCNAAADVQKVFWYVNKVFIGSCPAAEQLFFRPQAGPCQLVCVDDKGRSSRIHIKVSYL